MTTYRIRMKWERDPTRLWRDVQLGSERTLGDLARIFTPDAGLTDTAHLWFFGVDGKYWQSTVKYLSEHDYREEKAKRNDSTRPVLPMRTRLEMPMRQRGNNLNWGPVIDLRTCLITGTSGVSTES